MTTKVQRQAAADKWRGVARDLERRALRLGEWSIGAYYTDGLCFIVNSLRLPGWHGERGALDCFRPGTRFDPYYTWWPLEDSHPDFEARILACCLIATMIEAGDIPC